AMGRTGAAAAGAGTEASGDGVQRHGAARHGTGWRRPGPHPGLSPAGRCALRGTLGQPGSGPAGALPPRRSAGRDRRHRRAGPVSGLLGATASEAAQYDGRATPASASHPAATDAPGPPTLALPPAWAARPAVEPAGDPG